MQFVTAALIALALVLLLTPLWMRAARRLGAVDHPRGRHRHRQPTPTAGGLVICAAAWAGAVAVLPWPLPEPVVGMLIASTLLVALNMYDDIHGLPPLGRLAAQLLLAALVFVWGVRIEGMSNIGGLFGKDPWVEIGWASFPVTVIWIVLITNALNWLDGLDGLAAGVAGIAALTLALMAGLSFTTPVGLSIGVIAAALCGSCLGFLRYNFTPARVFMGDTGAMFLGFMLACLSVLGAYKVPTAVTVALPLLVLGVPLYDSTSAILRRLVRGKSPFEGDRNHIHHRLVDRGLSVRQAVLTIYGVSGGLCLVAFWLWWQ